jgi:hypothetical protein
MEKALSQRKKERHFWCCSTDRFKFKVLWRIFGTYFPWNAAVHSLRVGDVPYILRLQVHIFMQFRSKSTASADSTYVKSATCSPKSSSVPDLCVHKYVQPMFTPNFTIQKPVIRLVFGSDGNFNVCILSGISLFLHFKCPTLKSFTFCDDPFSQKSAGFYVKWNCCSHLRISRCFVTGIKKEGN